MVGKKQALLVANSIWEIVLYTAPIENDNTTLAPHVPDYHRILQVACCHWRLPNIDLKQCYKVWANGLYGRLVPGKFDYVLSTTKESLHQTTHTSLVVDWDYKAPCVCRRS